MCFDFSLNSAIDPYLYNKGTHSLEHKKRNYIVVGTEKYIYVIEQVRKDFLQRVPV